MKLVYSDIEPIILLEENIPYVLNIESPKLFRNFLIDFQNQLEFGEGKFLLYENDKTLQLSKCMNLIVDPLNTNVNQRKILQKLYFELDKLANDAKLFEEAMSIRSAINKFILDVEFESDYLLEHNIDFDLKELFSAVSVKFVQDNSDFLPKLAKYLEIYRKFLNIKALVLVNISSYLTNLDLQMLFDVAAYNKLAILMIENNYVKKIANERLTIIDNDLCIVYNDSR